MRTLRATILLSLMCLFAISCSWLRLRRDLVRFESTPIVLPDVLLADSLATKSDQSLATLVYYVDSTECTSCFLSKLYSYPAWSLIADTLDRLNIYLIVSPDSNTKFFAERIARTLAQKEIQVPLYIDVNHLFSKQNPSLPHDPRFHCFLLDSNYIPVFVGNPFWGGSENIEKLFIESYNQLLHKWKRNCLFVLLLFWPSVV